MRADAHTGERIRERREELGLTQRDLDARTSYSYAYVSHIESGERTPSLSAVIEFAAALNTSALYLATGRHDRCRSAGDSPRQYRLRVFRYQHRHLHHHRVRRHGHSRGASCAIDNPLVEASPRTD